MSERAPRRRGCWFAVMVTLLLCLMARAAVADDESQQDPRLLVFSDQLGDPLVSRVLGELRSQGFEVITVSDSAAGIPDREVLAMAEAARAVAAVRIVASESAVDLKVTDSMTENTFVRRLEVEGDSNGGRAANGGGLADAPHQPARVGSAAQTTRRRAGSTDRDLGATSADAITTGSVPRSGSRSGRPWPKARVDPRHRGTRSRHFAGGPRPSSWSRRWLFCP